MLNDRTSYVALNPPKRNIKKFEKDRDGSLVGYTMRRRGKMKRAFVLALGFFLLGMPTTTPAHNEDTTVTEDSIVQLTATADGAIHFGNRQKDRSNESMTLNFDDDDDRARDDDKGGPSVDDAENADIDNVIEFKKMIALPESMAGGLSDAAAIRGVQPGGRAWKLSSAEGELKENGELKVTVQGLLQEGEDMNTSSSSFRALVSCIDETGDATFITPDFPVDELGNARIEHRFDAMGLCIAPIVFVGSGSDAAVEAGEMGDLSSSEFRWFAVTGHSIGGPTPSLTAGSPSNSASTGSGPATTPGNIVPPLSDVSTGGLAPSGTGNVSAIQPTNRATATPAGITPPATPTAPLAGNSAGAAAGTSGAAIPPAGGSLSFNSGAPLSGLQPLGGLPSLGGFSTVTQPASPGTALPSAGLPPITGSSALGTIPPATAPAPIVTAPPAPVGAPVSPGPPDAGIFSASGALGDDLFPNAAFDDSVSAFGFSTAPGLPITGGTLNNSGPFRFDGNFTDLAIASPVF